MNKIEVKRKYRLTHRTGKISKISCFPSELKDSVFLAGLGKKGVVAKVELLEFDIEVNAGDLL